MTIARLTADLTRKIAAGEVIQRPASVVKELLENAIDAKSERIEVELAEGGRRLILVRDDGEGMDEADLRLSTERYATSKIKSEADLSLIRTLGFRGEALASIAAVSRMRIVSRTKSGGEAHSLVVAAGEIAGISLDARGPGTTVVVEDLFFNLPARARFLGTPRTEFLHVNRTIQRLALLFPGIGWSLTHDGREVFSAPRAGSLLDRIAQIYGVQTARAMIPLDGHHGEIKIDGFISRPDLRRGSRRDQLFSVNGRAVTDRGLSYVLASAYRGILRPGSYPLAVIRISLPLPEVDVNVHPRKEEVRFTEPRRVQDALSAALQQALATRHVVSSIVQEKAAPKPPAGYPLQTAEPLPFDLGGVSTSEESPKKVRLQDRRVIGQLQSTYLLVETEDGLEIIDQHIAHERILYESLRAEFETSGIARQLFLLPVRVELPFETAAVLSANLDALKKVGIVIEEFGGGTFLYREYPRMLAEEQSRRGFQQLTETLASVLSEGGNVEETLFDRVIAEMACAAAIKAGQPLSPTEAQSLIERLMTLENPYTCPHGRPIIFTLSRAELDRRFGRS